MASNEQKFEPIKTCETCGKNDLMTSRSLHQHVTDKEDKFHKGRDLFPVVCSCGRRFMTSQEMTSHSGVCQLKTKVQQDGATAAVNDVKNNVGNAYLKRCLDEYFEKYVKLNEAEMEEAKQKALMISKHLLDHLRQRFEFKKMNLSATIDPVGSSFDGLKVAPPNEFDMLIPINLASYNWELVDGRTAQVGGRQLNAPGFWLVKKRNTQLKTPMDPFLNESGEYIAPGNVIRDLQRKIHKIIKKFKTPSGVDKVKAGVKGPSLYMQVDYTTPSGDNKKFDLDFVLEVRFSGEMSAPSLVAKRHPMIPQQGFVGVVNPMALLWQESNAVKESMKIRAIHTESVFDCRKKCWKLVKAFAGKNKLLGSLCTYFYKTLFLHLMDEIPNNADWHDTKLAERFLDVFKKMEDVLHRQCLPLYFNRDVNILVPRYQPSQIENVYYYVRKMNQTRSHMQLFHDGPSSVVKKTVRQYPFQARPRQEVDGATGKNAKPQKRKSAAKKPGKKRATSSQGQTRALEALLAEVYNSAIESEVRRLRPNQVGGIQYMTLSDLGVGDDLDVGEDYDPYDDVDVYNDDYGCGPYDEFDYYM